jgi:EpsI family protein
MPILPNDSPQALSLNLEIPWWRSAVVLASTALALGLCYLTPNANTATESGIVLSLPYQIGPYWGTDTAISLAEKTLLPDDTQFARKTYEDHEGDQILCSIVLSGGEKRSIHRPEVCLPGQGWTVKSTEPISVRLANGKILDVMKLDLVRQVEIGPGRRINLKSWYLYWFVGKNTTTPYHWTRVFQTSWDRVFHNTNHRWAYVIVTSTVTEGLRPNGKSAQATLDALQEFISSVAPTFMKKEVGGDA